MSDKILNIAIDRLQSGVAFAGNAIINVPVTPKEFPLSDSRVFRIVVTSGAVAGTIVPTILESDTNADFTNATQVSLLQTYARGGLIGQDAIDSATITTAKFNAGAGQKEYFIACNPTKKYFGLRLTGTGTATATLDVDIIYMPAYLPIK